MAYTFIRDGATDVAHCKDAIATQNVTLSNILSRFIQVAEACIRVFVSLWGLCEESDETYPEDQPR